MKNTAVRAGLALLVAGWVQAAEARSIAPEIRPAAWVIDAADYTGEVKEQIARFDVRYTIRVLGDGTVEIPLSVDGATVTAIEIEKKTGEAHLLPRDGRYVFTANRKGIYRVRVTFASLLAQDSQFEGVQLGIPRATFSTMQLAVPRKDVELRLGDQLYVERKPGASQDGVTLVARLGAADRIDLKWRTKPADPVKVEPVIYGDVQTLVTVEEQLARMLAVATYRVSQGEVRSLVMQLPGAVNVLNVRGAGIDDWKVAEVKDGKTLTVALNFPLKDAVYQLIIEGETPIAQDDDRYELPEIRLTGVKQERGYLAVARAGAVELAAETAEGINRIDVKELPDSLKASGAAPALLAFKYHQHPYRAVLALTRHEDHPVLAAIAERGELVTVVSRQGEILTRATYLLKANKKQFLEVRLPDEATLWSCLVAGRSVKPVEGKAGNLLVPLDAITETTESVSVELVYFERRPELVRIGQLTLNGPVLDVPTTVSNWMLYAPREVRFLRMQGNLERGAAMVDFIEDPFAPQTVLASQPMRRVAAFTETEKAKQDKDESVWAGNKVGKIAYANQMMRASAGVAGTLMSTADMLGGRLNEREYRDDRPSEEPPASIVAPDQKSLEGFLGAIGGGFQQQGILPLKIQLPRSGRVYRFHRLMTAQDALRIETTYVHLRASWLPFAAMGLVMMPIGGLALRRVRRS